MKIKKITLILTITFTLAILTLTFTARDIKNNYFLPNVKVTRLANEQYEVAFTLEDGTEATSMRSGLAINKNVYDNADGFYIIENRIKNGENRTFVKQIYLNINNENEASYIIENGIGRSDFLVVESNKTLKNGDEVFVVN